MSRPAGVMRSLLLGFCVLATGATVETVETARGEEGWPQGAEMPVWAVARGEHAQVEAVSPGEAARWLRWVIPLPKRVRLEARLTVPRRGVVIELGPNPGEVEKTARDELTRLIHRGTPSEPGEARFHILLGKCTTEGKIGDRVVPGAAVLKGLKNAEQAYVVAPLEDRGLVVTALSEQGVYYGTKTLQQLLEANNSDATSAVIPVAAVLDWPDLSERGQWGGNAESDLPNLADRKMNLVEVHADLGLNEQGQGTATIDTNGQKAARVRAINWVPIITHLDHLEGTGIFKRYPELKGKGDKARYKGGHDFTVACFSNPKTAEILAQWMACLAEKPGVTDVNVWLTEVEDMACECERCRDQVQYVLEAQAAVNAWHSARAKHPDLRLRILLTQGSYPVNDRVLAAIPAPVRVTYYSGSHTYDSSRNPMIYPLLEEYARQGRWLGVYPQLTASWRVVCPWSGPQFIKCRMNEFVQKGLQSLCGYATPDNAFYDFNVAAAAEWSWNAQGRSEREFAAAWATRRRLSDPDKVAEWAITLGPVGWDVYGAGVPYSQFFHSSGQIKSPTRVAQLIQERKAVVPGAKGVCRYLKDAAAIEADLAACQKAMTLAEALGDPAILAETRVIRGYVEMIASIRSISLTVAGKEKLTPEETQSVQAAYDRLAAAAREVAGQLEAWRSAIAPGQTPSRFDDTVEVTRKAASDIGEALKPLGIKVK